MLDETVIDKQIYYYLELLAFAEDGSSFRMTDKFVSAEKGFIEFGKEFIERKAYRHGCQALKEMGVSEVVLKKAGIVDKSLKALESDFIKYAKPAIEADGITYQQLLEQGISERVLKATGIKPEPSKFFRDS